MTDQPTPDAVWEAAELRRRADKLAPIPAPTFTTNQLADRRFYDANRDEIHAAIREGRIEESEPTPVRRVEYPPSGIEGLKQVGPSIYVAEPPKGS